VAQNAARGHRLAPGATAAPFSPAKWHARVVLCDGRRYRAVVLPLGFRFDVDAVLIGGVAHRKDCEGLQRPLPNDAVSISAAGVHQAQRCPRGCPKCRPPFETMLSYQLARSAEARVP
jgi:hypothetical protein